jgi:glutamyl-tRNA synthetase
LVRPVLARDGLISDPATPEQQSVLSASIPLIHERLSLMNDAGRLLRFAFVDEVVFPREELLPKGMDVERVRELLAAAWAKATGFEGRTDDENERILRELAEARGVKLGDLLMPLRVAVTGSRASPPLFACMRLVGRDVVAARVDRALELLKE